jgi:hypothetical protein
MIARCPCILAHDLRGSVHLAFLPAAAGTTPTALRFAALAVAGLGEHETAPPMSSTLLPADEDAALAKGLSTGGGPARAAGTAGEAATRSAPPSASSASPSSVSCSAAWGRRLGCGAPCSFGASFGPGAGEGAGLGLGGAAGGRTGAASTSWSRAASSCLASSSLLWQGRVGVCVDRIGRGGLSSLFGEAGRGFGECV